MMKNKIKGITDNDRSVILKKSQKHLRMLNGIAIKDQETLEKKHPSKFVIKRKEYKIADLCREMGVSHAIYSGIVNGHFKSESEDYHRIIKFLEI
jgi:hypothetical protein